MSINIGGIDLFSQGLNNEYRISILESILDHIVSRNPTLITKEDIESIKKTSLKRLQIKYPHAGITDGGKK